MIEEIQEILGRERGNASSKTKDVLNCAFANRKDFSKRYFGIIVKARSFKGAEGSMHATICAIVRINDDGNPGGFLALRQHAPKDYHSGFTSSSYISADKALNTNAAVVSSIAFRTRYAIGKLIEQGGEIQVSQAVISESDSVGDILSELGMGSTGTPGKEMTKLFATNVHAGKRDEVNKGLCALMKVSSDSLSEISKGSSAAFRKRLIAKCHQLSEEKVLAKTEIEVIDEKDVISDPRLKVNEITGIQFGAF